VTPCKRRVEIIWPAWVFIFLVARFCSIFFRKKSRMQQTLARKSSLIPYSKHNVVSFQYEGYWTDIGNIHSFFEANLALTQDVPEFNLFDNNKAIYTRARMLPPAKISGTTLEKTIVAEGCIINASRVENFCTGYQDQDWLWLHYCELLYHGYRFLRNIG